MRLPIQYALTAPDRIPSTTTYLDISQQKTLTFAAPNLKKFPCLDLAYRALDAGKTMPAVLNTANEEAVRLFLDDKIKFQHIPKIIEKVVAQHQPHEGNLDHYMQATMWAREKVKSIVC